MYYDVTAMASLPDVAGRFFSLQVGEASKVLIRPGWPPIPHQK
jgi:hypothetical protein